MLGLRVYIIYVTNNDEQQFLVLNTLINYTIIFYVGMQK